MTERLTDEQLLAWRDKLGGPSVGVVTELLVLRARVAKLEAVLREARGWVVNFDHADNYQRGATLSRIDAALKDAPQ